MRITFLFIIVGLIVLISPSVADLNWVEVNDTLPWETWSYGFASCVWDNQFWLSGGYNTGTKLINTSDGFVWTSTTTSGSGTRLYHGLAGLGDKLYLYGGQSSGYKNDVYSSDDGITWTLLTSHADWSDRVGMGYCTFDDKIWVIGGNIASTEFSNETWYSSDGINWVRTTQNSFSRGLDAFPVVVWNDKMWVVGGAYATNTYTYTKVGSVYYSSDGITWTCANASAFPARDLLGAGVHDDKLYVFGGVASDWSDLNDVWYTEDGVIWYQDTNAPWAARNLMGYGSFNDVIFVISGDPMSADTGNIWASDIPIPPTPTPTPTPVPTTPCPDCPTQVEYPRRLEAVFIRTPNMGDCPLNVTFTDVSVGSLMRVAGEYENVEEPYTRDWSFGDGTEIEDAPAVVYHEYTEPGKYTVMLTIHNSTSRNKNAIYNAVYVTGAKYPNPTTTFGKPAMTLNDASFDVNKYSEVIPSAYMGVFSISSANGWFYFWGFVFAFIFLAIFIRVEDVSLIMLFALLVAGSVLAIIPSDFRMIGQGLLILAIASVIYVLIKGRFK